jgi:hypothetical protein
VTVVTGNGTAIAQATATFQKTFVTRGRAMWFRLLLVLVLAALTVRCVPAPRAAAPSQSVTARVVAVGIPGAGAVSPVGRFHAGGPIHDKPNFAAFTQAGNMLDPERIFVTSSSNFGAARARDDQATGAVLSIDPRTTEPLLIPPTFANSGGQTSTLGGRVQLFTAQNPAFLNGLTKPGAATADQPAVSNPLGISINNAFGRVWLANMPLGPTSMGTETIIDPDGRPLADAPSERAGGVFAGGITNRAEQRTPGVLNAAAIGNAFVGRSPDGGGKAVFVVVASDGSVVQIHSAQGLDGLAPAGTIKSTGGRAGVAFNWTPDRIVFIADPAANKLAALTLADDGAVFRIESTRRIETPELSTPIDVAPAVPEVANPEFSSNTTLAGGSDLYVANRGNGTIVRMRQDGRIVATRSVQVPGLGNLGPDQLNGIAVSPDASRLWLTVSTGLPRYADAVGAVLEIPAFSGAATP